MHSLGSTWDGAGVGFSLYSEHAERVELCLFDAGGSDELERVELARNDGFVWRTYLPQARPGQRYGYRVHGPHAPTRGHRFDPRAVLIDPYARLVLPDGLGRCQVVDDAFAWDDDRSPRTPWADTVIYEMHVKGFTRLHREVPESLRGTYAGLASAAAITHLKRLGVTAVELLPIHCFVDEPRLVQHGLRNYWGYNSIGFFAPEPRYSASGTLDEFKAMVKTLHAAGIEVILDVVYNHTGEGDELGPTLSFRGIDNSVYYRLDPHDRSRYLNYAGTGNTLNTAHPAVLALVMDSLRYWVKEMHVDGFRFDLAVALTRDSAFLEEVARDPLLSSVKLIAEPWDVGPDGYRLGRFPPRWSEWNDKYRDTLRSWWRGDPDVAAAIAPRLAGSRDLLGSGGRGPEASINFVTAHDGFTLHDLLTYERKRNEANQEGNRDGADDNRSWNAGALREQQKRNLLATLLLSQGVPMLLAGDEIGRSQRGNNNAYCQDNELSWIDWNLGEEARALLEFTSQLVRLRKENFFTKDTVWITPDSHSLAALTPERVLLLNAGDQPIEFRLPPGEWRPVLDTAGEAPSFGAAYPLQARSLALLVRPSSTGPARAGG